MKFKTPYDALSFAKKSIGEIKGKTIYVKGPCSLGVLSALDALQNYHGYRVVYGANV